MSESAAPDSVEEPAPNHSSYRTAFRPLRIALLGYRSNPFSGGQGIYLRYLSRALAEAGHQVDVISGEPYPQLYDGVNLIRLPGLNLFAGEDRTAALRRARLRSATDVFEWLSTLTGGFPEPYTFGRRLKRYFASSGAHYDIIHDNQSLCYGLLKLARTNPLVCTIHHPITRDRDIALAHSKSLGERLLIRRWHSFLAMQTRVARRLPCIVTVSESSKRDVCAAFGIPGERVHVIYNGIDTQTFRPEPGIARNPRQLIAIASADQPLKGVQYLIHAFADLCRQFPNLRLTLVGSLGADGRTARLVRSLNLEDRTRFVRDADSDHIRKLYAESAIAAVPSVYEGFGLPAGEAMACGVPVVSTDGGALPEVVGDAGRIVPARDPAALSGAIATLLNDERERYLLSQRGRQRILDNFSWQRAARQVLELYESRLT